MACERCGCANPDVPHHLTLKGEAGPELILTHVDGQKLSAEMARMLKRRPGGDPPRWD